MNLGLPTLTHKKTHNKLPHKNKLELLKPQARVHFILKKPLYGLSASQKVFQCVIDKIIGLVMQQQVRLYADDLVIITLNSQRYGL